MIVKKTVLSKLLSNGLIADVSVVLNNDIYQAALYVDGRHIPGPALPVRLAPPKGEVTYWMGNHPSIGLTSEENEKITYEVYLENSVLEHRKKGQ